VDSSNRRGFVRASIALALGTYCELGRGARPVAASDSLSTTRKEASEAVVRTLTRLRDRHELPGMVGGVVQGDDLVAIGAVGVRKAGSVEPMTTSDLVHLGSDTKAMTATMIGSVVEEGKLQWNSTFERIFPELASRIHAEYRHVTLWQLLTHRAGLPANGPWWALGSSRSTTEQRRGLMRGMLQAAPLSRPGTKFLYSNVGYALAGLMTEEVTGLSWERLMRERLFGPLGMTTAGFGPPGALGKVEQPWGHRKLGASYRPFQVDNPPALGPAGTVHCSLADWGRFASLHLQAARGRPLLLKRETFDKLQTPPPQSVYACGWGVGERGWAKGRILSHAGSNTMWYAVVTLAPRRDLAVLVATNAGGDPASKACQEAIKALAEIVPVTALGNRG